MTRRKVLRHGSLFSGIGGFDLAAEWCGWRNIFHCEINEFCNRVLNYYWPKAASIKNIIDYEWEKWKGKIDVLTGGFPCQPYSVAGKRRGKADPRHLWPYMLRAIQAICPTWVVGENVRGLISWDEGVVFDEVQADLEAAGYEVVPFLLPAAGVDAPHRRERIWFIAHADGHNGGSKKRGGTGKTQSLAAALRPEHGPGRQPGRADRYDLSGMQSQQYDAANPDDGQQPQQPAGHSKDRRDAPETRGVHRTGAGSGDQQGNLTERIRLLGTSTGILQDATANSDSGQRSQRRGNTQRSEKAKQQSGKHHAWFVRNTWQDFPTQPALCDGDDGLSGVLDNISFSKWRSESLKAGGNAIVPQVVYQLFRVIQQLSRTIKTGK